MSHSLATPADTSLSPVAAADSATPRLLALATLLLALTGPALYVDLPLARFVGLGKVPGDLARLVTLSEAFAYGGTVALIILMAATLDGRRWRVVPRLAITAFGAGLLADGVKLLIARERPSIANLSGHFFDTFVGWLPLFQGNHRLQSFPSGHTATAVGLAIALSTLYPRGWWLFASIAALSGFQRIESESHFLSDVLVGAAIGCLIGAACTPRSRLGRWLVGMETSIPEPSARDRSPAPASRIE
jgi:membrane-associated phospholipid phosphatase